MPFQVPDPETYHPLYMAGDAGLSYGMTGLGLYVALLEPFIVKSVRRVLDRITDPELRDAADRFCRQEAQHYQQHERFNALVFEQRYPGLDARYEALRADFESYLNERDDKFRIGFVEGFEANTTQGALALIGRGLFRHPRTDRTLGALWEWHMLEEIEHRHVAFDLYQHLYGDWLYRARMCWIAQHHMATFIDDCTALMSPVDVERFGPECALTPKARAFRLLSRAVPRVRSMLPSYTPHRYEVPVSVSKLSARLSAEATSVS
jgi:predicted metal-dependent hydrolase